ncbi:MAG TPA: glutamate synthase subunit beta [Polyangiaceae bacterium]|nr:glutamate synthase subunit beta [Polyangiaceae bacterium]
MGKITGFLEYQREEIAKRPIFERVNDWREFELPVVPDQLVRQGARCMDCGIPFCNSGCPLGNLIPDFNDLAYRKDMPLAVQCLHSTNNFPEITGRVCPAPCEAACVLGINQPPVTIKQIEHAVGDYAIAHDLIQPLQAQEKTGKRVAVVGSGPAGMAAAQQLARAGHSVTLFEKDDRPGGLLTYGIPDFKLSKEIVIRRVEQMRAEGVELRLSCNVGVDIGYDELRNSFDAICVAIGSKVPRDLPIPGRELQGIHFAMDFLEQQNRRNAGDPVPDEVSILAANKQVVVIGGGDTGSDCIGTSHRQGAANVTNLEIMPRPPESRDMSTPWPNWPLMLRTSSSHEEGGTRQFSVTAERFEGEGGRVTRVHCAKIRWENGKINKEPGSEFSIKADLVLLAMGFLHPEQRGLLEQLGAGKDQRGNLRIDRGFMTSVPGVFAAGDCQRGQSLVVWAIADGRRAARAIDRYLMQAAEL